MAADWTPLTRELTIWRRDGLDLPIWWRDDDAVAPTPALDRIAGLSSALRMPLNLAVIPAGATEDLADYCADHTRLIPLVHGWAHQNHAPDGAKKAEFNHPRPALVTDAKRGLARLRTLFGETLVPVFVPPWNRISPDLLQALPGLGYAAVSTFTPRTHRMAAPGLVAINTHLDPIDWRGGGGVIAEDVLIARTVALLEDRRAGRADPHEPLGLLTHHLVHDAAIWAFTERWLGVLLDAGARPVALSDHRDALP